MEFTQRIDGLIGEEKYIKMLETKDLSRLLVVSDSHGETLALKSIIKNFGKTCDALIFCGDGLCDIARILSNCNLDEELKNSIPPVIALVRGNCDPSSYPVTKEFFITAPDSQALKVNGQNIVIFHGHKEGVKYGINALDFAKRDEKCKTFFYGHTHVARELHEGDFTFINPGSCTYPRSGQPPSFAIATVGKTFISTSFIKINYESADKRFSTWQPF